MKKNLELIGFKEYMRQAIPSDFDHVIENDDNYLLGEKFMKNISGC